MLPHALAARGRGVTGDEDRRERRIERRGGGRLRASGECEERAEEKEEAAEFHGEIEIRERMRRRV